MSQATAKLKHAGVLDVTEKPIALLAVGFGDGLGDDTACELDDEQPQHHED